MKRRLEKKHFIVALSLLALVTVGGFTFYHTLFVSSAEADAEEIQTAVVRQGDLVIYASGSGTLLASDEIELGFGANGPIEELNVQAGDSVQAGDVLAVEGDREELEADVAEDQLAVMDAQEALEDLLANAAMVTAQAQLDLADAKEALRTAEYTWTVQQEGNRASQATLNAAEAKVAMAEDALEQAKRRSEGDPENAMLLLSYASAQTAYDSALRNWNWYTGHPTEIQQAQLDAEVALAEAKVAAAERAYEEVKDGPDSSEVERAKLQLANAEAKLAVSQRNLEESVITAPVGGTILQVSAEVGQEVTAPFITMADLSKLYVEVFLDETDADKIAVDYEVEVTFDALPDQIFTGCVVQVDPSLYSEGQMSVVKGLVQLDTTGSAAADTLMLGMNAAVDVISGKAEGVPLVPVEALRELSPGEYGVFVMQDGELELRTVEVGLTDLTFAEIKSGLNVGDVVSTGIAETQS